MPTVSIECLLVKKLKNASLSVCEKDPLPRVFSEGKTVTKMIDTVQ